MNNIALDIYREAHRMQRIYRDQLNTVQAVDNRMCWMISQQVQSEISRQK